MKKIQKRQRWKKYIIVTNIHFITLYYTLHSCIYIYIFLDWHTGEMCILRGNCYHDATRGIDPLKSNPDWFTGNPKACGYLGAREGETGSVVGSVFSSPHMARKGGKRTLQSRSSETWKAVLRDISNFRSRKTFTIMAASRASVFANCTVAGAIAARSIPRLILAYFPTVRPSRSADDHRHAP